MMFQALLVSTDDAAAAALTPVLAGFGLPLQCCDYPDALRQLTGQYFDAVLVDFDDPLRATAVLENAHLASPRNSVLTVALLQDKTKVRQVFGAGANFILYKPISQEQAQASLRAATALIRRERRRSLRVPVQVPVQLRVQNGLEIEGILLDLSEDGMEILGAQPLCPSTSLSVQFNLPEESATIQAQAEVAWANPNGQAGVRFLVLGEDIRAKLRAWVAAKSERLAQDEPGEPDALTQCKLTDLSQGGCYVETESPFPERSGVVLHLKAGATEAQAQGMVRVMHPGFGMGIEFASSTAGERSQVETFIRYLTTFPGTAPELTIMPRNLAVNAGDASAAPPGAEEVDDPLLDLLRGHESLGQEEFLQELHRQRTPLAVTSS